MARSSHGKRARVRRLCQHSRSHVDWLRHTVTRAGVRVHGVHVMPYRSSLWPSKEGEHDGTAMARRYGEHRRATQELTMVAV